MKKQRSVNLFLIILTLIILLFPILLNGVKQSFFYGIDPGIVYVTNAVLYTKAGIISYMDHPGTPTIMLIHYSFIPLRLISKFILDQNFIQWSFDNFTLVFLYERLIQLSIVSFALFLIQKSIVQLTKSNLLGVLMFLLAFSFAGVSFGISITPENLSFLLTAIWIWMFVKYLKNPSYVLNIALTFIAGFAFANKFTSLFLLILTIILPLINKKSSLLDRFIKFEANLALSVQSFLLGIWPIVGNITWLINWIKSIFGHTKIHGTGQATAFNANEYLESLLILIKSQPFHYTLIIAIILLGLLLIIKKRLNYLDPVFITCIISFVGIIVFSKFPLIHYNYINFLLIIFSGVYFLSKIKTDLTKLLIMLSLLMFIYTSYGFINGVSKQMRDSTETSEYEVLSSWTPYWSSNVYEEQFNKISKP